MLYSLALSTNRNPVTPPRHLSRQAPTIVFGADVNHPGAGNVSKPSIAAVVASMDRWVSRHGSCVAVQEHRKEVIQVRWREMGGGGEGIEKWKRRVREGGPRRDR